jgi:hypothetical protein
MHWYFYLLEFLSGALLANGVPHFVQGISGAPFQSPFARPPGVGESSPVSNVVWGFCNLLAGFLLLHYFHPCGRSSALGWIAFGAGVLFLSLNNATHFGRVRSGKHK